MGGETTAKPADAKEDPKKAPEKGSEKVTGKTEDPSKDVSQQQTAVGDKQALAVAGQRDSSTPKELSNVELYDSQKKTTEKKPPEPEAPTLDKPTLEKQAQELHDAIHNRKWLGTKHDADEDKVMRLLEPLNAADRAALEKVYKEKFGAKDKDENFLRKELRENLDNETQWRKAEAVLNRKDGQTNDAGALMVALTTMKDDKDRGNQELRVVLSTLNKEQLARLDKEFKETYGKSWLDEINKHKNLSNENREYMHYIQKGTDGRDAGDIVSMANIALKYKNKEMFAEVVRGDGPAATEARKQLNNDANFVRSFNDQWGGSQPMKDILKDGRVSLATIATDNTDNIWFLNNKDNVKLAAKNASDKEREDFKAGRELALAGKKDNDSSLTQEQRDQIKFYNRLHKAFDDAGEDRDVAVWEDQILRKGGGSLVSQISEAYHEDWKPFGWGDHPKTNDIFNKIENMSQADYDRLKSPEGQQFRRDLEMSLKAVGVNDGERERAMRMIDEKMGAKSYEDAQKVGRRTVLETIEDNKGSKFLGMGTSYEGKNIVDGIANMGPAEAQRYKDDAAYRKKIDDFVKDNLNDTEKLFSQRLLERIAKDGKTPQLDSVDKILQDQIKGAESPEALKNIEAALKDKALRERLNKPNEQLSEQDRKIKQVIENQIAIAAMKSGGIPPEGGGHDIYTERYRKPLFEEGRLPVDLKMQLGFQKKDIIAELGKPEIPEAERQRAMERLKPQERQIVENAMKQNGELTLADKMRGFVLGDGSNYQEFKQDLEKLSNADKQKLKDEYTKKYGGALNEDFLKKVDEKDSIPYKNLLTPTEVDDRQNYYDLEGRRLDNSGGVAVDGTDLTVQRASQQYAEALEKHGGKLPKEVRDQLNEYFAESIKQHAESKEKLAEIIVDATITAVAITATIASGGVLGPVAIAAIAAGSAAFRVGMKAAIQGNGFDLSPENVLKEGAIGALTGALAALGPETIGLLGKGGQLAVAQTGRILAREGFQEAVEMVGKEGAEKALANFTGKVATNAVVNGEKIGVQQVEKFVTKNLIDDATRQALKSTDDAVRIAAEKRVAAITKEITEELGESVSKSTAKQTGREWLKDMAENTIAKSAKNNAIVGGASNVATEPVYSFLNGEGFNYDRLLQGGITGLVIGGAAPVAFKGVFKVAEVGMSGASRVLGRGGSELADEAAQGVMRQGDVIINVGRTTDGKIDFDPHSQPHVARFEVPGKNGEPPKIIDLDNVPPGERVVIPDGAQPVLRVNEGGHLVDRSGMLVNKDGTPVMARVKDSASGAEEDLRVADARPDKGDFVVVMKPGAAGETPSRIPFDEAEVGTKYDRLKIGEKEYLVEAKANARGERAVYEVVDDNGTKKLQTTGLKGVDQDNVTEVNPRTPLSKEQSPVVVRTNGEGDPNAPRVTEDPDAPKVKDDPNAPKDDPNAPKDDPNAPKDDPNAPKDDPDAPKVKDDPNAPKEGDDLRFRPGSDLPPIKVMEPKELQEFAERISSRFSDRPVTPQQFRDIFEGDYNIGGTVRKLTAQEKALVNEIMEQSVPNMSSRGVNARMNSVREAAEKIEGWQWKQRVDLSGRPFQEANVYVLDGSTDGNALAHLFEKETGIKVNVHVLSGAELRKMQQGVQKVNEAQNVIDGLTKKFGTDLDQNVGRGKTARQLIEDQQANIKKLRDEYRLDDGIIFDDITKATPEQKAVLQNVSRVMVGDMDGFTRGPNVYDLSTAGLVGNNEAIKGKLGDVLATAQRLEASGLSREEAVARALKGDYKEEVGRILPNATVTDTGAAQTGRATRAGIADSAGEAGERYRVESLYNELTESPVSPEQIKNYLGRLSADQQRAAARLLADGVNVNTYKDMLGQARALHDNILKSVPGGDPKNMLIVTGLEQNGSSYLVNHLYSKVNGLGKENFVSIDDLKALARHDPKQKLPPHLEELKKSLESKRLVFLDDYAMSGTQIPKLLNNHEQEVFSKIQKNFKKDDGSPLFDQITVGTLGKHEGKTLSNAWEDSNNYPNLFADPSDPTRPFLKVNVAESPASYKPLFESSHLSGGLKEADVSAARARVQAGQGTDADRALIDQADQLAAERQLLEAWLGNRSIYGASSVRSALVLPYGGPNNNVPWIQAFIESKEGLGLPTRYRDADWSEIMAGRADFDPARILGEGAPKGAEFPIAKRPGFDVDGRPVKPEGQTFRQNVESRFDFEPQQIERAKAQVVEELGQIKSSTGGSVLENFDNYRGADGKPLNKDRVLSALAEVREHYLKPGLFDVDQETNWIHTQGELGRVLDSARRNGLTAQETEDALLASMFSDAVKHKANFTTHHLDGALAADQVLRKHLGGDFTEERLRNIIQAVREHQISPPQFMAMIYGGAIRNGLAAEGPIALEALTKKLDGQQLSDRELQVLQGMSKRFNSGNEFDRAQMEALKADLAGKKQAGTMMLTEQDLAATKAINDKFYFPLDGDAHGFEYIRTPEGGYEIKFSEHEKELLRRVGVENWYVPTPDSVATKSPWHNISRTLIDGDSIDNYATPGGFGKIVKIRGPETDMFFKDKLVDDSIKSVTASREQALRVMTPEGQKLLQEQMPLTEASVAKAKGRVEDWLRKELGVADGQPLPEVPFWNKELKYPQRSAADEAEWWKVHKIPEKQRTADQQKFWLDHRYDGLTEQEIKQFEFAGKVRDQLAEELRREQRVLGDAPPLYRPAGADLPPAGGDANQVVRTVNTERAVEPIPVAPRRPGFDLDGRPEGKFRENVEGRFDFAPEQVEAAKTQVRQELGQLKAANGKSVLENFDEYKGVDGQPLNKDRVLSALSEVREHYLKPGLFDVDQETNWIHTQGELGRVLDSARRNGLTAQQTEDALLASMFSDAVKHKANFTTHHLDGALAADQVLRKHLGGDFTEERLRNIIQAVREHQISPPQFMAMIYGGAIRNGLAAEGPVALEALTKKLDGQQLSDKELQILEGMSKRFNGGNEFDRAQMEAIKADLAAKKQAGTMMLTEQDLAATKAINDKFYFPLDGDKHGFEYIRTPDGGYEIKFSDHEKELLRRVGVENWYVPTPDSVATKTPWDAISRTLIDGDSIDNYATPGGFGKIVKIRGPETDAFFKDKVVDDSIKSVTASREQSLRVMTPEGQKLLQEQMPVTEVSVARAKGRVEDWLRKELGVADGQPLPEVPFWNKELKYPQRSAADEAEWWKVHKIPEKQRTADQQKFWLDHRYDGLTEQEIKQFEFAGKVRDQLAEELRREQRVLGDAPPQYLPTPNPKSGPPGPEINRTRATTDGEADVVGHSFDAQQQQRGIRPVETDASSPLPGTKLQVDQRNSISEAVAPDGTKARYEYEMKGPLQLPTKVEYTSSDGTVLKTIYKDKDYWFESVAGEKFPRHLGQLEASVDPHGNLVLRGGNDLYASTTKLPDGATIFEMKSGGSYRVDLDKRITETVSPSGMRSTYEYNGRDITKLTETGPDGKVVTRQRISGEQWELTKADGTKEPWSGEIIVEGFGRRTERVAAELPGYSKLTETSLNEKQSVSFLSPEGRTFDELPADAVFAGRHENMLANAFERQGMDGLDGPLTTHQVTGGTIKKNAAGQVVEAEGENGIIHRYQWGTGPDGKPRVDQVTELRTGQNGPEVISTSVRTSDNDFKKVWPDGDGIPVGRDISVDENGIRREFSSADTSSTLNVDIYPDGAQVRTLQDHSFIHQNRYGEVTELGYPTSKKVRPEYDTYEGHKRVSKLSIETKEGITVKERTGPEEWSIKYPDGKTETFKGDIEIHSNGMIVETAKLDEPAGWTQYRRSEIDGRTHHSYSNPEGQVVNEIPNWRQRDANGRVTTMVTDTGLGYRLAYDKDGKVNEIIWPGGDTYRKSGDKWVDSAGNNFDVKGVDVKADGQFTVDLGSSKWTYMTDGVRNVESDHTLVRYNARGMVDEVRFKSEGKPDFVAKPEFDEMNKLVRVDTPAGVIAKHEDGFYYNEKTGQKLGQSAVLDHHGVTITGGDASTVVGRELPGVGVVDKIEYRGDGSRVERTKHAFVTFDSQNRITATESYDRGKVEFKYKDGELSEVKFPERTLTRQKNGLWKSSEIEVDSAGHSGSTRPAVVAKDVTVLPDGTVRVKPADGVYLPERPGQAIDTIDYPINGKKEVALKDTPDTVKPPKEPTPREAMDARAREKLGKTDEGEPRYRTTRGEMVQHKNGTFTETEISGGSRTWDGDGRVISARRVDGTDVKVQYDGSGKLDSVQLGRDGKVDVTLKAERTIVDGKEVEEWYQVYPSGLKSKFTITGPDGAEKAVARVEVNSDGALVFHHADYSGRRIQVDGTVVKFDKNLKETIDGTPESIARQKEHLAHLRDTLYSDPQKRQRFDSMVENFEKRMRDRPAGDREGEIANSLFAIRKMLEADNAVVPKEQRAVLAEQLLHMLEKPHLIDQGALPTCNVTAEVLTRLFAKSPSDAIRLVTEPAVTGRFITADGVIIDMTQIKGGLSPMGSSQWTLGKPFMPNFNDIKTDGSYNFAEWIAMATSINAHRQSTVLDSTFPGITLRRATTIDELRAGIPYHPGDLKYEYKNKVNLGFLSPLWGEEAALVNDGKWVRGWGTKRDIVDPFTGIKTQINDGARISSPDLSDQDLVNLSRMIVGKQEPLHYFTRTYSGGDYAIQVKTEDAFRDGLLKLQKDGDLPATVRVDTRHPPFNHKEVSDAGGRGGAHVVEVHRIFQDDAGEWRVEFSNQWGTRANFMPDNAEHGFPDRTSYKLSDLYRSMEEFEAKPKIEDNFDKFDKFQRSTTREKMRQFWKWIASLPKRRTLADPPKGDGSAA